MDGQPEAFPGDCRFDQCDPCGLKNFTGGLLIKGAAAVERVTEECKLRGSERQLGLALGGEVVSEEEIVRRVRVAVGNYKNVGLNAAVQESVRVNRDGDCVVYETE